MDIHELVRNSEPFKALHAEHVWTPYVLVCDGYKVMAYKRSDGAGHVCPDEEGDFWWPSWSHPMQLGAQGWVHVAFGRYSTKEQAAAAFDKVYDLERIAGNIDRMTRADAAEFRASLQQQEARPSLSQSGP